MIKGFIFDLDGVIADTAKFHFLAWKELADKLGISIDEEFNNCLKGISRMDSLERILAHGNQQDVYTQEEKDSFAEEKNGLYLELLKGLTPADILPGALALIKGAKEQGVKIALASASQNGPFILSKLGLDSDFDYIVNPANLTNGKPDPEIFVKAAEGIGVSVSECIGFEDAQAGMDGIKGANMYGVAVITEGPIEGADLSVVSLTELDLQKLIQK